MPRRIAFTSPKLDPEFAVSSNTRYEKMSAPGAMPRIPVGGEPRPAIMPAKCVPCDPLGPNWFSGDPGTHPSPPATTRSGCPASTPESMTPTFTPAPTVRVAPTAWKCRSESVAVRTSGAKLIASVPLVVTFFPRKLHRPGWSCWAYTRSYLVVAVAVSVTFPVLDVVPDVPVRAAKSVNPTTPTPATGLPVAAFRTVTTSFFTAAGDAPAGFAARCRRRATSTAGR